MTDQIKNTLIGLFVVIACALIIGMILFIEPSVGDGKQTIIARFSNINGISVGTRVLFAGKAVGEVAEIQTIPHAREQPIDHSGNVYFYQLVLHIDSSIQVFNTDEITVSTSGLLGEKSIAIIPKAPPKNVKPKRLTAKTPAYAISTDPLENAFNELSEVAGKIDEALDSIVGWFNENRQSLTFAVDSFGQAMNEISTAVKDVNEQCIIDDIKKITTNLASTTQYIDSGMHQLRKDRFFINLAISMQNFRSLTGSIKSISQDLADGTGTIGKLITSDDMYLKVNAIISKIDTLMNDVNHYGLMFNLNKQWQRTRLKQITLLNALNTPKEFRSYFEGEVDRINMAMSRISMLIDKANEQPEKQVIFKSAAFREDFASLLRQVQELSDTLKLYNQELNSILNREGA